MAVNDNKKKIRAVSFFSNLITKNLRVGRKHENTVTLLSKSFTFYFGIMLIVCLKDRLHII
jgi:hypothetical protein